MNYKKILIIICAVLFFLAALTSYINRIIFPRLIKKIAIERIESALNRKVEIGSIRFNWIKGFIIDKIKIYEKDSPQTVFAQAQQVSFGMVFFPGLKQYRISIPYINATSPSVHLIRTGDDTWNFSDIVTRLQPAATPATSAPTATKAESLPAFEIAWGGISFSDGKCLVNDISHGRKWSEFFDNINLKISLSYQGIHYDFTADIPGKKGSLGAIVYYQPITHNARAQIHLGNIDTASYLSLINVPDVHLNSGLIEEVNLNINYVQDKTAATGDVIMKNLNIISQEQNFKGDIEIRHLDAEYRQGDIMARGQMALSHIHTSVPGLEIDGSVQTKVNDFELTKEGLTFIGSLHAQDIFVNLKDRQVHLAKADLDNIKIRKNKEDLQSVGSVAAQGLLIQWPNQKIQGDISLKNVTMRMNGPNDISLEGALQVDNFATLIDDKNVNIRHALLDDLKLNILDQKNIALITKLSLNDMKLEFEKNILTCALLETDKLSFNLDDGIIKTSSTLNASKAKLVLNSHTTVEAAPHLELELHMPLTAPKDLTYKGSMTFSDGHIQGPSWLQSLDNVELDTDFQTDKATINAFSFNILDSNLHLTGTAENFKNPFLNITADADELNLAKIKDLAPAMTDQYGLTLNGTGSLKVQFKGWALDPLAANIMAMASVNNASIVSSKFHQQVRNISGIIEVSPDSLKWRDFTATYLDKKYTFAGSMENLKTPKILTTFDGPDLHLNAGITKNNAVFTINSLTGKFMKAAFNSKGTVSLLNPKEPLFDISTDASIALEDLIQDLPPAQKTGIGPLNPTGIISVSAHTKGPFLNWKNTCTSATITAPVAGFMGYKLTDIKISIGQEADKIKNLTFDGKLYGGTMHAAGTLDLSAGMPYNLAFNIDNTDLHLLKMDSPLKMQEINGKFYSTIILHGKIADFKNNLHATGSLAVREGYLGEFDLFKGLFSVLNDALKLGQVMITDVEANFTVDDQKINTDNLQLKGPTIVLLGKGWVNFDQICNLNITVDLSSGVVPAVAHNVLKSLNIHIYDKITSPKFKKKISVPQVINSLLKDLWE